MSNGNTGLGTSSQNFNANGVSNQQSQTTPFGPAMPVLSGLIGSIQNAAGGAYGGPFQGNLPAEDAQNYNKAISNVGQLPNFGPAAAQTASNFLQTGGDPTGILRKEASNLNPIASENLDPTQTPGMKNVLDTIRNDISNQVNGQFAGAGRSLSGLNEQTLSRGLAQGEAVPLLNQYNQNFANMLGANQQLGNVQSGATSNIGQGLNFAQLAPQLAQMNPMIMEQLTQQRNLQPMNYIAQFENLINPIAGLGGSATGSQQTQQQGSGTATNSLLGQLGQAAGLFGPFGQLFTGLLG
jgi:hypothetical protein